MPVELYPGYSIDTEAPELHYFEEVCKRLGLPFAAVPTGGGSDANIMRNQGLPVITLGIGYSGAHTLTESIIVQELENLTRLVVALCEPDELVPGART
jgi:di/tripeptidase